MCKLTNSNEPNLIKQKKTLFAPLIHKNNVRSDRHIVASLMNLGVLTAFLSPSNQTSQRPFQRIPSVDGLVACMVKRIDVSIQSLFYAVILIIFQKVGNKSLRVLQGEYFFLLGLKFFRIKKEYPIGFVYIMDGSHLRE